MPPPPPTCTTPPLDAHGFIAADVPCINCRYNLRTLQPSAVCPECGVPVAASISGLLLRCAPLLSVLRLRTGVRLMLGGHLCLGIFVAIRVFAAPLVSEGMRAIGVTSCLLSLGMQVAGILITTSRRSAHSKADSGFWGSVARVGALLVVPSFLLCVLNDPLGLPDRTLAFGVTLGSFCFGTANAGLCYCLGNALASLDRQQLGRTSKILGMSFGSAGLLLGIGTLLEEFDDFMVEHVYTHQHAATQLLLHVSLTLMVVSVLGTIISLPFVLRSVSAEIRIAQDWAKPNAACAGAPEGKSA